MRRLINIYFSKMIFTNVINSNLLISSCVNGATGPSSKTTACITSSYFCCNDMNFLFDSSSLYNVYWLIICATPVALFKKSKISFFLRFKYYSFIKIAKLTCFHQLSPIKIRVLVSDQVWPIQLAAHLITKMYFCLILNRWIFR